MSCDHLRVREPRRKRLARRIVSLDDHGPGRRCVNATQYSALPEARKCTIGVVRHCLSHASRRQTAPDEFGEARLRAHAQKRGAQLQDVQRWRAFLISLLEPLQSPALIAKTAVNHG